jgi:hypothetical protein
MTGCRIQELTSWWRIRRRSRSTQSPWPESGLITRPICGHFVAVMTLNKSLIFFLNRCVAVAWAVTQV